MDQQPPDQLTGQKSQGKKTKASDSEKQYLRVTKGNSSSFGLSENMRRKRPSLRLFWKERREICSEAV
jgi:hypothetical protein